jgi:16S rRNA processing protein RimM
VDPGSFITVGRILGAHGVHGAVKVQMYAESTEVLTRSPRLFLRMPSGTVEACEVEWAKPHSRGALLQVKGIEGRDGAEGLKEALLEMPRQDLPALEEGTYYWFDLIGMEVFTRDGASLGSVEHILETGSNDVYVVRGREGEVLVPALADVVIEVDVAAKRMRVDLPDGL